MQLVHGGLRKTDGRARSIAQINDTDITRQQALRAVQRLPEFSARREEILGMIWEMEEEIMGKTEAPA